MSGAAPNPEPDLVVRGQLLHNHYNAMLEAGFGPDRAFTLTRDFAAAITPDQRDVARVVGQHARHLAAATNGREATHA